MSPKETQKRLPPYVSYATWQKLVQEFAIFLPNKVDSSYYRELRFSGSDTKKLRTSLRFLGLVDENNVPTEKLQRLVQAIQQGSNEKKAVVLEEILRNAYPSLFASGFSLKTTSFGGLTERFEEMDAKADVLRQCISFFLHMATEANIELSPHLAGKSRLGIGRKSTVLKARERRRKRKEKPKQEPPEQDRGIPLSQLSLGPAMIGLLSKVPSNGQFRNKAERDRWKRSFDALFEFLYPIEGDE